MTTRTPAPTSSPAAPDAAVVFCVEFGPLEDQAVLLARSIRKWGGEMAGAELYAVRPRFNPPLSKRTRQAFDDLDVRLINAASDNPRPWNMFINKPVALLAAEAQTQAQTVVWLDSDILALDNFSGLIPAPDEDVTAAPSDKNVGTSGPDDPHDAYWKHCAASVGVELEALPYIQTNRDNERIRMYFNSGVFAYRRTTGFGPAYLESCLSILRDGIASSVSAQFFTDQVALALTIQKVRARWRALETSYNFAIGPKLESIYEDRLLAEAKLLHYHNSMWPGYFDVVVERLSRLGHGGAGEMLASHGPLRAHRAMPLRLMGKALKRSRAARCQKELDRASVY